MGIRIADVGAIKSIPWEAEEEEQEEVQDEEGEAHEEAEAHKETKEEALKEARRRSRATRKMLRRRPYVSLKGGIKSCCKLAVGRGKILRWHYDWRVVGHGMPLGWNGVSRHRGGGPPLKGRGGSGSPKFVYQKLPKSAFLFVNFMFSQKEISVQGGGVRGSRGGHPPSSCSCQPF